MKEDDFKTGGTEPADPLSATGMFLRTFGEVPEAPAKADPVKAASTPAVRPESSSGPSLAPSRTPGQAGPGEFTQMFQSFDPPSGPRNPAPSGSNERLSVNRVEAPAGPAAQAPGEFTRVFLGEAGSAAPPPSRVVPQSPLPGPVAAVQPVTPASALPPRKGFSSPGVSDSVSGEGAFTRMFQAMPAPQSAAPPAPSRPAPFTPEAATPARQGSSTWPAEAPRERPMERPVSPSSTGQSATGLISSLGAEPAPGQLFSRPAQPAEATPNWAQSPTPYSSHPPDTSGSDAGSVTRLIERLSQVNRDTQAAPPAPVAAAPPIVSGPGEMTRILSGDVLQQKSAAEAAAQAASAPQAAKAAPLPAMPVVAMPHMPAVAPAQAVKVEPVHFAAPPLPKPAAPALPALAPPKGKLEAMVPILLVINTFLLIVLLVVVVFALKGR